MKKAILYILLLFVFSACSHTPVMIIGDLNKQEPLMITAFSINKVKKVSLSANPVKTDSTFLYKSDMDIIDFEDVVKKNNTLRASCYNLSTSLKCGKSQSLYLMYGSTGKLTIWIDDKRIVSDTIEPLYKKYANYVPVYLEKGNHTLLVEVDFGSNGGSQKIIMAMGNYAYAKKRHHELFHQSFLDKPIAKYDDRLALNIPFADKDSVKLEVLQDNKTLFAEQVSGSKVVELLPHRLKSGIYICKVQAFGNVYRQPFAIGNPDSLFLSWKQVLKTATRDSFYRQYVNPITDRYEYLSKYRMHAGQRVARFGISLSGDEHKWTSPLVAESKATLPELGGLKINKTPYQYLQITGYGNSFHSWNAISEVKIWGGDANGGKSHELVLAGISASSFEGNNYPANVNDNNVSTCWESASEGDWIRFDLQNSCRIDSIQIAWKKDIGTSSKIVNHEKEIAACLWQINAIVNDLAHQKEPVRNKGGKSLRGYYSPTDVSVKQYLVQAPEQIDTSFHYPLIIHIVPRVETPAPLGSSYLIGSAEVDRMSYEVKKRNIIDVWSFLDNYDGIMFPSCRVHYLALVKQLKATYPIDTNRIYFMATCSGSVKAIQLADELSNPLAAMSFCPAYWDTAGLSNGRSLLYNTRHIPIQVINSKNDNMTPISGLYRLIAHMKSVGAKPADSLVNGLSRDFYVADQMSHQLDYLLMYRTNPSLHQTLFKTSQLKHGPVSDFYTKPSACLVACDNKKIKADIVEQFKYLVFKKYVRTFRFIEENELNESTLKSNHVMIIIAGNAGRFVKELVNRAPVYFSNDELHVGNNKYSQIGKGFVCIYPNPLNKEKYVLLVDISQFGFLNKEIVDLMMQSNYDYKVFDNSSQNIAEILQGNFDNDWLLKK